MVLNVVVNVLLQLCSIFCGIVLVEQPLILITNDFRAYCWQLPIGK